MTTTLQKIIQQKNIHAKYSYIALDTDHIEQKTRFFNSILTTNDIKLELVHHQQKYFPDKQEKLVFDLIIPKVSTQNTHQKETMIFAAKEIDIQNYIQSINKAGLKTLCIESNSYALLRTILYTESIHLSSHQAAILFKKPHAIFFDDTKILYEQDTQNIDSLIKDFKRLFPTYYLEKIYVLPLSHDLHLSLFQHLNVIQINPLKQFFSQTYEYELLTAFGTALRGLYDRS